MSDEFLRRDENENFDQKFAYLTKYGNGIVPKKNDEANDKILLTPKKEIKEILAKKKKLTL